MGQGEFRIQKKDCLAPELCKDIKPDQSDSKEACEKLTTDWFVYYHAMRNHSDQDVVDEDDE
jgi:hypothetical protein